MDTIEFSQFTPEEHECVMRILRRGGEMNARAGRADDALSARMDLARAHYLFNLRLDEWAAADDFNFGHDWFGIGRHLNRETGEMGGCFVPRFAGKSRAA